MRAVLYLEHKQRAKMIGKVFAIQPVGSTSDALILYHEERGTQWHVSTDSPGGVDECVLRWLQFHGVKEIHHARRSTGELYVASVEDMIMFGMLATWDGRTRRFMPRASWDVYPGSWYAVPWIPGPRVVIDESSILERFNTPAIDRSTDRGHEVAPEPDAIQKDLFDG
jgi:hypothetical protein